MGIESNKEAMAMMKRALQSMEGKMREAYNKGYKDGLRDGASQVTARLIDKILEETEADTPQTEQNCENCKLYHTDVDACIGSQADFEQTDCSWK